MIHTHTILPDYTRYWKRFTKLALTRVIDAQKGYTAEPERGMMKMMMKRTVTLSLDVIH